MMRELSASGTAKPPALGVPMDIARSSGGTRLQSPVIVARTMVSRLTDGTDDEPSVVGISDMR